MFNYNDVWLYAHKNDQNGKYKWLIMMQINWKTEISKRRVKIITAKLEICLTCTITQQFCTTSLYPEEMSVFVHKLLWTRMFTAMFSIETWKLPKWLAIMEWINCGALYSGMPYSNENKKCRAKLNNIERSLKLAMIFRKITQTQKNS